ncbi:MAG: HDOD domain-containing protein [Granulosicoccus sp.]
MSKEQSLISLIDERLSSGDVELPVFDDIALRVHKEVRENKLDADSLCKILEEDPVLVSEILRMSNSSFFAGLSPVTNLRDAAVRLGIKQIAAIVLSVNQKKMYSASDGPFKDRLYQLWLHSSAVSMGARHLATNAGYRQLADDAFVTGLLHDVGKLSLLCIIESLMVSSDLMLTDEIVDITIEQLYCEHGAKLLDIWNLPDTFKEVVLHQDDETFDDSNVILCLVRVVNQACVLEGISDRPDRDAVNLEALPETQALGVSELDLAELRLVLEDLRDERKVA